MVLNGNVAEMDRINLRLSSETFAAIDKARSARPGRISRNTWIAEAIEAKLAEEASSASAPEMGAVSNA
jgi:predicted DNA binding CopG/RHH family protein